MSGGAIPATGRRTINPAWEFISLRTQPAPLRCALALRVDTLGLANQSFFVQRGSGRECARPEGFAQQ
jgi:hypothetical protein